MSSVDYKESSKILKVFSRDLGIISIMARGAKRPKSRMQNLTSLYTIAEFQLIKRRDFYYLSDGEIIDINSHLRRDIKKLYSAELCLQFLDKSFMEGQVDSYIYELVIKSIKYLANTECYNRLVSMFLVKYMSLIGYQPQLNRCVICGKKNMPERGFSKEYGGITCLDHEIPYTYLKDADYKYFLWLLYSKIDEINNFPLQVDEKKLAREMINFFAMKTEISKPQVLEVYSRFMLD